jgi:hypothetical protein
LLIYTMLRGLLGFVPLPPLFPPALLCIVVGYVVAAEMAKKAFYSASSIDEGQRCYCPSIANTSAQQENRPA